MNAWPVTPGKIISSEIALKPMRSSTKGSGGALHLHWTLVVQYSYEVGGHSYVGNRPSSRRLMSSGEGGKTPPDWLAQKLLDYPPGKKIHARYDPDSPGESVLEIDHSQSRLLSTIGAASMAAAGLLCFVGLLLARK